MKEYRDKITGKIVEAEAWDTNDRANPNQPIVVEYKNGNRDVMSRAWFTMFFELCEEEEAKECFVPWTCQYNETPKPILFARWPGCVKEKEPEQGCTEACVNYAPSIVDGKPDQDAQEDPVSKTANKKFLGVGDVVYYFNDIVSYNIMPHDHLCMETIAFGARFKLDITFSNHKILRLLAYDRNKLAKLRDAMLKFEKESLPTYKLASECFRIKDFGLFTIEVIEDE